ncbi:MAG: hypothetical protein LIP23_05335 [Planctomycetes bacterium]|nr:hypothetical protein [Planctomycetota bacterium]
MTAIGNYSQRKRKLVECCEDANPVSRHIIDADCDFEDGVFKLISLPARLPLLFTVRFTAPADYAAGSVLTLKGEELAVKTSVMEDAPDGMFSIGAVVQCDIDMERNLAFLQANQTVIEERQCFYPRVDLYVETTGDDDTGDGSEAAPLKSMHGVFALLERDYKGYIKRLYVHLGYGYFSAPRVWLDVGQNFSIEFLFVSGKNDRDNPYSATTIGERGCSINGAVPIVRFHNVSFLCESDVEPAVLYINTLHSRVVLTGYCEVVNLGTVAINGVSVYGHSYFSLGSDAGDVSIQFRGKFLSVIYASSHSVINVHTTAETFFRGSSTNLIFMHGTSSMFIYSTLPPVFVDNFTGNIRAICGSTIAFVNPPADWLPAGSQWLKDDISRITGQ